MAIRISAFTGEVPRVIPRLLPDAAAQTARHVHLDDGALTPIGQPLPVASVPDGTRSVCFHAGTWMTWQHRVSTTPGPVASERLYITGDTVPKVMLTGDTVYPLALKAPAGALTATGSEPVDGDDYATILYTYTFVTVLDEESPPAPASNELLWEAGIDVTLSGFSIPPSDRGIDRRSAKRAASSTPTRSREACP